MHFSEELDYETKREYNLNITVIDSATPRFTYTDVYRFTVLDMNEPPTRPTLSHTHIVENAPNATIIGQLRSIDLDFNQSVTFRLLASEHRVAIDENNAVIAMGDFNYEVTPVYRITVIAVDNGTPQLRSQSHIDLVITDVNEAPTDAMVRPRIVKEYVPAASFPLADNEEIGVIHIQDPDNVDRHRVMILDQGTTHPSLANRTCFRIDAIDSTISETITLRVADKTCFDYEKQSSFAIIINVTDSGGLSLIKRLEIFVKDMNEPPTGIIFSANLLHANAPLGMIAGTLIAIDDSAPHKFELTKPSQLFTIVGKSCQNYSQLWVNHVRVIHHCG